MHTAAHMEAMETAREAKAKLVVSFIMVTGEVDSPEDSSSTSYQVAKYPPDFLSSHWPKCGEVVI